MFSYQSSSRLFSAFSSRVANTIPFKVKRTSADNIPVYTIKRFNKSLVFTQVRKVRGETDKLRAELTQICGSPARLIADGVIEINGDHRAIIKRWLVGNGF